MLSLLTHPTRRFRWKIAYQLAAVAAQATALQIFPTRGTGGTWGTRGEDFTAPRLTLRRYYKQYLMAGVACGAPQPCERWSQTKTHTCPAEPGDSAGRRAQALAVRYDLETRRVTSATCFLPLHSATRGQWARSRGRIPILSLFA
jgi:hypothetical protein